MREGWYSAKLGDLCEFENGDRGKNYPGRKAFVESGVPFINAGHLTEDGIDLENMDYIPRERFDLLSNGKIREGDLLFCLRGSLGKFSVVEGINEGAIASSLIIVRPKDKLNKYYLAAYFSSHLCSDMIAKFENGAAQPNLSAKNLASFEIPLPPIPDQRRIVAVLDEALEAIGTAVANAEKNLANARELFESYLNSIFARKGDGWIEKKLGEVAAFKNGLNFTKSSKGEIIKIVGVKDFQRNFYVPTGQLETVQIDGKLSSDYELRAGDILTVRSNGNKQLIGRCILANDVPDKTSHSGFTIRIRAISKDALSIYLNYFLKSKASRDALIESGDGANISSLNQQALSALPVSLPPISEQQVLADNIQALEAETKSLEILYRRKLACLTELKQIILQKAFAGELTAQSAEVVQEAAE
ncbi:restriction endonuclease subunit S [Methylobacterium sp. J-043]|nr:restriction endonuclease subunit S [Methylobacterium sp. J-043]